MTAHDAVLSERECWELLATASVGRLALSVRALPVILPVQY
jgi:nitroimidazol reductase NimA-like FMN-containing flavoprotein (pyridoxamine 5'-phosphate oxidase superfamily)